MVTLTRLNRKIREVHCSSLRQEYVDDIEMEITPTDALPLPDPQVLDSRLVDLVELIETGSFSRNNVARPLDSLLPDLPNVVISSQQVLELSCKKFNVPFNKYGREFNSIGLSGNHCGSTHRSLDDGSNYAVGSASPELNFVATRNDGPRYLRALGVPINFTRYAIVSIVNENRQIVEKMLEHDPS